MLGGNLSIIFPIDLEDRYVVRFHRGKSQARRTNPKHTYRAVRTSGPPQTMNIRYIHPTPIYSIHITTFPHTYKHFFPTSMLFVIQQAALIRPRPVPSPLPILVPKTDPQPQHPPSTLIIHSSIHPPPPRQPIHKRELFFKKLKKPPTETENPTHSNSRRRRRR
jgi:hypothetical protein